MDDSECKEENNDTFAENSCRIPRDITNEYNPPIRNNSRVNFQSTQDITENIKSLEKMKTQSYGSLFRFADGWDWTCIIVGSLAAIVHGAGLPVMFIFFGDLTTRFSEFGRFQQCSFSFNQCAAMNLTSPNETLWSEQVLPELQSFKQDAIDRVYYFLYVALMVFVLGTVQVYAFSLQSVRRAKRLRIEYFRAIMRQDITFHDKASSGQLTARLSSDIKKAKEGMGEKVSFVIQYVSMTLTGITIGLIYTWKLGLVALSVAPLLVLSGALLFILSDVYSKKELAAYSKSGSVAEEAISAIRTVTAFGCQNKEVDRYTQSMCGARKAAILRGFMSGLGIGLLYFSMFGMYGLSFWYGSTLVIKGEITAGDLTTSFFGILIASFALGTAGSYLGTFAEAKAAITHIFEMIDRVPSIDVFSRNFSIPTWISGDIVFDDVSFSYPTRSDHEVLNEISFTVGRGQTVALVGHSGCGKSTIIQMIQRFYDPTSGSVTIGGENIQRMRVRSLRDAIGVVSQEPVLFATTIAENIRWGRKGISDKQVHMAARQANAFGFISRLPKKFNTLVGEGGSQLSGGQKQRISIARAIVRDPKILLLDEATSALDTGSEQIVQKALKAASKDRTTIVIAHRLSTIRNAKKIVVLSEGKVAEQGTHSALLRQNGLYASLYRAQTGTASVNKDNVFKDEEMFAIEDDVGNQKFLRNDNIKRSSSKKWNRSWSTRILKRQTSMLVPFYYMKDLSSPDLVSLPSTKRRLASETDSDPGSITAEDQNELDEVSFWQLLKLNATEWPYMAAGCLFAAVAGAVDPVNAIVFAKVLGIFILPDPQEQNDLAVLYGLIFLALGAISLVAFTTEATLFSKSGIELTLRLRKKAYSAILCQDISYFDELKNNTGTLCSRLSSDAALVQGCTGSRLGVIIKNFSSLGVALGIGFVYSWKLTLVTLGFVPFIILGGIIEMTLIIGDEKDSGNDGDEASQIAAEAIKNIRTVASLSGEEQVCGLHKSKLNVPVKKSRKRALLIGAGYGYSQCVIFFVAAATFRLGIDLLESNEITFENVFKVLTAVFFGAMAVGQNSSFAPDFAEAKLSAARLFNLFNRNPIIDPTSQDGHSPAGCKGSITLRSISFTYPSRPHTKVLKGLDITVEAGKTLALVGQSGCGKSTIVQLLERFYDPQEGEILIDGTDIREMNVSWLRQQIGIVAQEPVLFNETIKENILYGDQSREIQQAEIEEVAMQANAHEFISGFPETYNTIAGEQGGQLSGGQKQRVAIARALLRDPKILLLDEATSALDAESEKLVQTALENAGKGRTTIIIAHRLSTVKKADQIAVIDRGKVVEKGTHNQLIDLGGLYYSLQSTQRKPKNTKLSTSSLF